MKYADEELCDCLRQLADTLGETPTLEQCNAAETTPCRSTYSDRFGSWNAALKEAGLDVNEQSHTDAELIESLRAFSEQLGETPTSNQLETAPEMPSVRLYKDHFGTWNAALREAGLDVNEEFSFTDDELVAILQELESESENTPSAEQMENAEAFPSQTTYMRRFGSWNNALRMAGLSVNHEFEQYDGTDEELLDILREFAAEHDTSPTMRDIEVDPELPSTTVFQRRFNGWNEAKQQAGLETTHQPNQYSETELIQDLHRVSQTVEKPLTVDDIKEADTASLSTYQTRFGSWTEAKQEAGLVENQQPPTQ